MEQLLRVSGAARHMGCSEPTIRRWADSGRLPVAVRLTDGTRLFKPSDLDRLLKLDRANAERETATGAHAG